MKRESLLSLGLGTVIVTMLILSNLNAPQTDASQPSVTNTPTPTDHQHHFDMVIESVGVDFSCPVPCWHDFTPGVTEMSTVLETLQREFPIKGAVSDVTQDISAPNNLIGLGFGDLQFSALSDDRQPAPLLKMYAITLSVELYGAPDRSTSRLPQEVIERWLPSEVFELHGNPTTVFFGENAVREGRFSLILDFSDDDFAIQYYNDKPINGEHFCPPRNSWGVIIWVYSLDYGEDIISALNQLHTEGGLSSVLPGLYEANYPTVAVDPDKAVAELEETECISPNLVDNLDIQWHD